MKAIICYLSYSGNTEEIAELLREHLYARDYEVEMRLVDSEADSNFSGCDLLFIGTFTWDMGSVPEEMKYYIQTIMDKPENTYIFGSGDTQFGGDILFCRAVDEVRSYLECEFPGLKIEQSPRGSQERYVKEWLEGVINYAESKNLRTEKSE